MPVLSKFSSLAVSAVALAIFSLGACVEDPPTYKGLEKDPPSEEPAGGAGGSDAGGAAPGGASSGGSGTGGSGAGPVEPVEDGLLVEYTFDEGTGSVVHDTSGAGTPLDLTIADLGAVEWADGALHVNAPTIITSEGAASKIIDGCLATNELTMEAWIAPLQLNQAGPARIVTLSVDPATRDFTLGQQNDLYYVFRLRSEETNVQGQPELQTPTGELDVKTVLTHIVLTRSALGERSIYINGELRSSDEVGGSFANWDVGYQFALANELTGDRPWLGALHYVAVYDRPLGELEVQTRFEAGAP